MEGMNFGEYIESIRKSRRKSLREAARAIGVSASFYSHVEKGTSCAFTADRLEVLKDFLKMTPDEANRMYDKAAKSYSSKGGNTAIPQDFTSYIADNSYVVAALRTLKEEGADKQDWEDMLHTFRDRKARKDSKNGGIGENKQNENGG